MQRLSFPGRSLALALLASTVPAGCGVGEAKLQDEPAAGEAPVAVRIARAQVGDLFALYQATANVAADGEAEVPARIDGEVIETLVEEGDRVVQGQVLARIDGERLKFGMLKSRAELDRGLADYERQGRLHQRGLVSPATYEDLKFEVAELRAAYAIDRYNYGLSAIRAPISGVIAARYVRKGQHVTNGDPAFRITDTSRLIAEFALPQQELARIHAGQKATFTVGAYPGKVFDAEIDRLSPVVDGETGTISATARIADPDEWLAPGMFGRFEIVFAKHAAALNVPTRSIVREDGDTVVYRIAGGRAHRELVEVGITAGDRTELTAGLAAGDEVVVSGSDALRHGSRVATGAERALQPGG